MTLPPQTPATPKRRKVAMSTYTPTPGSKRKSRVSSTPTASPSAMLAGIGRRSLLFPDASTPRVPSSQRATESGGRVSASCRRSDRKGSYLAVTPTQKLSNTPSTGKISCEGDRFIPNRKSMDFDICRHILLNTGNEENEPQAGSDAPVPLKREFQQAMKNTLLSPSIGLSSSGGCVGKRALRSIARQTGGEAIAPRVLTFSERPQPPPERYTNVLKVLDTVSNTSIARASIGRSIPSTPLRILDAPDLVNDYYLNLVSWGHNNVLAVALGQAVYLWNAATGSIEHLLTLAAVDDFVTSVEWMGRDGGNFLAVGTNHSTVQLWDASKLRQVRTMSGHSARVGTLSWKRHLLSSGSRDNSILQHDVRMQNHKIATYVGHEQEVCGLKWSPDGGTLASGGNENFLCLWDACMSGTGGGVAGGGRASINGRPYGDHKPRKVLVEHQAAVKALAWCPFQRHLLGSGGGTADRSIKFWNTANGSLLNSVDTGSQVCALQWSKHNKELVSSHGFSENQLCLWKYPSMLKIKEFRGHTSRVLHMDTSPDGSTVVSAAADETLRFWDMFGSPPQSKSHGKGMGQSVPGSLSIMGNVR